MLYVVSMLASKQAYIGVKKDNRSLEYLQSHSLFLCYDTEHKVLSAPLSLGLLYTKYKQNPNNCAFTVEKQERVKKTKQIEFVYFLTILNNSFENVPVFCNTTLERLNKYRYYVLSRICENKITTALRLFDAVTRKELIMSLEDVYKHHRSGLGTQIDVIGNLRVFSNTLGDCTTYNVKSVCGTMYTENVVNNTEAVKDKTEHSNIVQDCFVVCQLNNRQLLTDFSYDYAWTEHNNVLELPTVTDVNICSYNTPQFSGAMDNITKLVIPATVVQMSGLFLAFMRNLETIECLTDNYKYVNGVLYDVRKRAVLWVNKQHKTDLLFKQCVVNTYALRNVTHCKCITLENCVVERCAFQDCDVEELCLGTGVQLKPGALRGMAKLKTIVIATHIETTLAQALLDVNTWLGLSDYNIKTKQFVGKTYNSVEFKPQNEQFFEDVAALNMSLLQR